MADYYQSLNERDCSLVGNQTHCCVHSDILWLVYQENVDELAYLVESPSRKFKAKTKGNVKCKPHTYH